MKTVVVGVIRGAKWESDGALSTTCDGASERADLEVSLEENEDKNVWTAEVTVTTDSESRSTTTKSGATNNFGLLGFKFVSSWVFCN